MHFLVAFWTNLCYINLYNKQTERNNMENTIKNVTNFNSDENSVQLYIDLAQHNLQVNGRKVESITMYCDEDCSGDLAVNWEEEDDSNYVHNSSMLMRDTSDSNNNTETMGQFYWEHCFDATLQQLLQQNGFSAAAAADVCGSEWGMQDVGRASYDAWEIANECLAAHNLKLMEA
jgi:hypothetical protein